MKDHTPLQTSELATAPLEWQMGPCPRILLVEDDIAIRQLITDVFSRSGYQVDAAEDGFAAWQILQIYHYDLLITDNGMPNMSGVELLKKLRAARMELPVIMATGRLPQEEFTRYPWLMPEATLLKPYTVSEMLRAVKMVLRETEGDSISSRRLIPRDLKNNTSQVIEPDDALLPGLTDSPKRILVVDEDSDLRLMYADVLAAPGYQVDVAEDGAAGWDELQAHNYNLLITENDLPSLTGVELVRKLRAARMSLPVVMAAGNLPTYQLARNPSLQIAATLVKPFPVEVLLNTVQNVLRAAVLMVLLQLYLPEVVAAQEVKPAPELRLQSKEDATQPTAMTLSVNGKCDYSEDGITFNKLEHGRILEQGTVVRTGEGAHTDLFFRRTGTTVRLQAGTEMRIEKMTATLKDGLPIVHTLLDVRTGRIFTVVRSAVAGSTLEIKNAAGRSIVEGSGIGRYIITADGTHVSDKGSVIPLKLTGENGITIIAAGQQFARKDGKMLPASPTLWVKDLIELDELQAATEKSAVPESSSKP